MDLLDGSDKSPLGPVLFSEGYCNKIPNWVASNKRNLLSLSSGS